MDFKRCIRIRAKSNVNFEKKFDQVFSSLGVHIVRNPAHFEHSLFFFSDYSQWWTLACDVIDELNLVGLQTLTANLSTALKTVTYFEPFQVSQIESLEEFHFSSKHNAFDEPPYIKEGPTVLKWFMYNLCCQSGEPFMLNFINIGGISKGLELFISGDFVEHDSAEFEPFYIHSHEYKKRENKLLTFEAEQQKISLGDGKQVYYYDFPDFIFPEGINQYSAALGFRMECINRRSVYLWTKPVGKQNELDTMQITFLPKTNKAFGLEWHHREPPFDLQGEHF